jgi:mRNA interferase RelE/StbE
MKGKGIGLHRMRVGNYRLVYRLQSERICVLVIRIGHRAEVYRGWQGR